MTNPTENQPLESPPIASPRASETTKTKREKAKVSPPSRTSVFITILAFVAFGFFIFFTLNGFTLWPQTFTGIEARSINTSTS